MPRVSGRKSTGKKASPAKKIAASKDDGKITPKVERKSREQKEMLKKGFAVPVVAIPAVKQASTFQKIHSSKTQSSDNDEDNDEDNEEDNEEDNDEDNDNVPSQPSGRGKRASGIGEERPKRERRVVPPATKGTVSQAKRLRAGQTKVATPPQKKQPLRLAKTITEAIKDPSTPPKRSRAKQSTPQANQTHAQMPSYTQLKENTYVGGSRKLIQQEEVHECDCSWMAGETCDDSCVNRASFMECPEHAWVGQMSNDQRKSCTNQRFASKAYAKVEAFLTENKGWGLKAAENIACGEFIIEYVGQVLDLNEVIERMRKEGDRRHHYFMALGSNCYIDASRKGNLSRFINHSCKPNAVTQTWIVNGEPRIGVFAIYEIPKGFEITFDYQFETLGKERQQCFCGEDDCRKFIGKFIDPQPEAEQKEERRLLKESHLWNNRQGDAPLVPVNPESLTQARRFLAWESKSRSPQDLPRCKAFLRRNVLKMARVRSLEYFRILSSETAPTKMPSRRAKKPAATTAGEERLIAFPNPALHHKLLSKAERRDRCESVLRRLWQLQALPFEQATEGKASLDDWLPSPPQNGKAGRGRRTTKRSS